MFISSAIGGISITNSVFEPITELSTQLPSTSEVDWYCQTWREFVKFIVLLSMFVPCNVIDLALNASPSAPVVTSISKCLPNLLKVPSGATFSIIEYLNIAVPVGIDLFDTKLTAPSSSVIIDGCSPDTLLSWIMVSISESLSSKWNSASASLTKLASLTDSLPSALATFDRFIENFPCFGGLAHVKCIPIFEADESSDITNNVSPVTVAPSAHVPFVKYCLVSPALIVFSSISAPKTLTFFTLYSVPSSPVPTSSPKNLATSW